MDFSAELAALQQAYAAALPDKIAQLGQMLAAGASAAPAGASGSTAAVHQAHRMVHGLAGSAGTFGFPALGEAARGLEELLVTLLNGESPSTHLGAEPMQRGLAAVRAASLLAPTAGAAALMPSTGHLATRHERWVCLVEGDAPLAASLAAQLAHFAYRVRVFAHPDEVVADAQSGLPVAIVMDVGLGGGPLDGPQGGLRALRQRLPAVPLLFISARTDFEARLEAVRAGGLAYFTKPVDIDALINALGVHAGQTSPTVYRVLIVDDSESTAAFYQHVLAGAGMQALAINDPSQIIEPLTEFAPDLILMDLYMPVCNGVELAALIRQQPSFVSIPIVFLSTETNTNRHLVALRHGGDDFLSKPIDPARLVSVVTSRAGRGRILRAQMSTDGLTGLLNHSHLKEQLVTEILRSKRYGQPLVFAMIDIDHFKHVNDNWGHAAGDRVLRSLAKLLGQRLRRTDVAGRYGGEEFGLILTDVDAAGAQALLDAIRRDFSALRHADGDAEFSVSFSAGIAAFPQHRQPEALIAAADAALYAAKRAGRDRIALDGDTQLLSGGT